MTPNSRPTPPLRRAALRKPLRVVAILIGLVVVLVAGLALFISTLNADKYRPQIVQMLSERTGRKVDLNGPISFSLGFDGLHIILRDAAIGNPPWASRTHLVGMGRFELGVELWPLLDRRLAVTDLYIENADILLETNNAGQKNWDLRPASASKAAPQPARGAEESAAALSVERLQVVNSQIAFRNPEGKVAILDVASLKLGMTGTGAEVALQANANGAPLTVNANAGVRNLLSKDPFGFQATATFSGMRLTAKGTADLEGKKADIPAFELASGDSRLTGKLSASWNGARPKVRADVNADRLDLKDFSVETAAPESAAPVTSPGATASSARVFSDTPLPVNGLKAVDADGTVTVASLVVGDTALTNVSAKIVLSNGNLALAPVKAMLGAKPFDFQLKLNASRSPAHLVFGLIANDVELGEVLRLIGAPAFIRGQGGMDVQLEGNGDTPRRLASSLGGIINVTGQKGQILTGTAAQISNALATLFNASGEDSLSCLAVRFIAKAGILADNGILVDTAASTIAGAGNVNLSDETINLVFSARPKIGNVGSLLPSFKVGGTLAKPATSVDSQGAIKNVIGSFLSGGGFSGLGDASGVPAIQTPPAGENACVYTLNHPQKGTQPSVLPATPSGRIDQKIQDLGNSLKGLLGQ